MKLVAALPRDDVEHGPDDVAVLAGASTTPFQRVLAVCALVSAIPVAPMVGWLDLSVRNVRYLYMPTFFVMLLVATALSNARWSVALLSAFAFLSLCCGIYNIWVYKTTYRLADELAAGIAADHPSSGSHLSVMNMPAEFNGVVFSRFEFQYRIQERLSGVTVSFVNSDGCRGQLCYVWQAGEQRLLRSTDQ